MTENPAVDVAKEQRERTDIRTLSTGVRVRITPVSPSLIVAVQQKHQYPDVPLVEVPSKGTKEPNPDDPDYQRRCAEVDQSRGMAALDAMILMGMELVDGMPEEDDWVQKLQVLGIEFDVDDPVQREFNYKRHVAIGGTEDMELVSRSSVDARRVERHVRSTFRGDEERPGDSSAPDTA